MKKYLSVILAFALVITLSACSGGISGDEAKTLINDFFEAVESGDYAAAETFLHPERPADLQAFFEGIEQENNLDFSTVEIEKYTGFESALYDSTVDGSVYSLTMKLSVSGQTVKSEIEIVKNDSGYGIYNLNVDTD